MIRSETAISRNLRGRGILGYGESVTIDAKAADVAVTATIGLRTARSQRWNVSPPAVQVRGLSSRSAAKRARPTPLKARVASSSHQIASFCLPQTAGTIWFSDFAVATQESPHKTPTNPHRTPAKQKTRRPKQLPIPPKR